MTEQGTASARADTQDPEAVQLDTGTSSPGPTTGTLTERQRQVLLRLLRVAYPHDRFPDGPYERTLVAVEAAAGDGLPGLAAGLDGLDAASSGDFVVLGETDATARLVDVEDAPFFRTVRAAAVVALYDDREVWALLGYEGPSFDRGGYLHRGFDDLDWLPDPRITEFVGTRTHVVTQQDGGR